jgi:D-sedoheptulose 7-phosphate isomerase
MHALNYLEEAAIICREINPVEVEKMALELSRVHRVYLIGLGGSLANCVHMAADLRKLCHIDAYAPSNLAELTAWINDDGWEQAFSGYLGKLSSKDALFVLSVGGGTAEVSQPITVAIREAKKMGVKVFGIVGPNGGETSKLGDCVINIPCGSRMTPHTEAFQAVIWHCLVSHPVLQKINTKW